MEIKYQRPRAADGEPIYEGQVLGWNGILGSCEGFEFGHDGLRVRFKNLDRYGDIDYPKPEALVHIEPCEEVEDR